MAWARMDDQFYDHPKVLALLDHDDGLAAIGLWSLALGWAKRHADPHCPEEAGAIPASLPRRLGGSSELAKLLVRVGLWAATGDGWVIHDFAHWQDLEGWADRSAKASRSARARWDKTDAARRAARTGPSSPGKRAARQVTASSQETDAPSIANASANASANAMLTTPHHTEPKEPPDEVLRTSSSSDIASRRSDVASGAGRADVEGVCLHLADRIEQNGSARPVIGKSWRDAARRMLDRDGRTEDQVHKAIDWCQDDEFWRGNIMSMAKLRQQYDRLRLSAARRNNRGVPGAPSTGDQRVAQAQALKAKLSSRSHQEGP